MLDHTIEFDAPLWLYPAQAAWVFVTVPSTMAEDIRFFSGPRRGFGSVRVEARIGDTVWKTSVFPDKKSQSYLLPIKAAVRKSEHLDVGDTANVTLRLLE